MWFRQEFSVHLQCSVFLVVCLLYPFVGSDPGWLSACNLEIGSGQKYTVLAEDCPHGVWLPERSSLECICVNGLWVLGDDWCDEDYQIIYGKGHCFSIDTKVRKISYVGNPENPFETKDYVTTSKGHFFASLNETYDMFNAAGEFPDDQSVTILRVKPQKDLSVILEADGKAQSNSVCLKTSDITTVKQPPSDDIGSLFIYSLFAPVRNVEMKDSCESGKKSQEIPIGYLELQPGNMLCVKSGRILESSQSCASNCYNDLSQHSRNERSTTRRRHSKIRGIGIGRAATKPRKNLIQIDLIDSDTFNGSSLFNETGIDPAADNCSEFNLFLKGSRLTDDEKRQMVNEETRRVIKIETNLLLNGEKGPTIDNKTAAYRHWFMLQNVKKVFLKVCPPTQIPAFIINSAMRIFRYIYIHTRDANPYGMHFEDKAQDTRIKDALETCFADGKPFEFHYTEFKDLTKCRNESKNFTTIEKDPAGGNDTIKNELKNVTYCKCSTDLDIVNFTYPKLNTSTFENQEIPFNLNKTIFILPLKQYHFIAVGNSTNSSLNKHDFITETIWKMINFAHFYCARNFENNPHDHSALFNKLESLFNNDIIYRWNNPSPNSAAIWKAFYTAYNLEKITTSLDACVAGAKEPSDYPKWLTRPTHQTRAKRELEKPAMWDGNGFCLRNPWEPLDTLGLEVPRACHQGKKMIELPPVRLFSIIKSYTITV